MELLRLGPGLHAITGHPALLLARPGERVLVVADLHIGWESALADKGFHIPSQVGRMLAELERLVDRAMESTGTVASPREPSREDYARLFEYAYEGKKVDF